jgi:hypothetical protein
MELVESAQQLSDHRVTKRDGGSYVTRGDSARIDDGIVARADHLGYSTREESDEKRVWLSLGPEHSMIGILARTGLLSPLVFRIWCYVRPFIQ